ncbi:MAG: SDR family oxidoreductase [Ktedonobacteraceae bacterium]|nr:SDR family oxidoreductase [Ktedonobacteraceae bacterium]
MGTMHVMDLRGKVALITGATGAMGSAAARALAGAGATVILVSRAAERLSSLVEEMGGQATALSGNVARTGEAERIVQEVIALHARLDILVNAAGGATVGGLLDLSDEQWQADFDLKLLGYLRMMRAAARVMRERGGGRIINIVGLAGHEPYHLLTAPSVVNAGLLALTKSAADELAPHNILVNAINPNAAQDELGMRMIEQFAQAQGMGSKDVHAFLVQSTPLKRLVTPEDVAAVVLFYASEQAAFITGTSLTLDGGAHRAIA